MRAPFQRIAESVSCGILATDLDGTLLEADSTVPDNLGDFLAVLATLHLAFVIATSRCPHDVAALFPDLQNALAVCSDGATVVSLNPGSWTTLHESLLSQSTAARILAISAEARWCGDLFLFSGARNAFTIYYAPNRAVLGEGIDIFRAVDSGLRPLVFLEDGPAALTSSDLSNVRAISWLGRAAAIKELQDTWTTELRLSDAACLRYPEIRAEGFEWCDIVRTGVSKGVGLQFAMAALGDIPLVAALGNSDNDVEMLRGAQHAFCPRGSSRAARAVARLLDCEPGHSFLEATQEALGAQLS